MIGSRPSSGWMREVVQWPYPTDEAVRAWIIGRGVSASTATVSRALERRLSDLTGSWRNGSGSAPEPNVCVANHLERWSTTVSRASVGLSSRSRYTDLLGRRGGVRKRAAGRTRTQGLRLPRNRPEKALVGRVAIPGYRRCRSRQEFARLAGSDACQAVGPDARKVAVALGVLADALRLTRTCGTK